MSVQEAFEEWVSDKPQKKEEEFAQKYSNVFNGVCALGFYGGYMSRNAEVLALQERIIQLEEEIKQGGK